MPKYLTRTEVSNYIKEKYGEPVAPSPKTLANLASLDKGPKYRLINGSPVSECVMLVFI